MNLLNIDLDFFINGRAKFREDSLFNRPDEIGLIPWSEEEVISFLRDGLNLKQKIPGFIVTNHDEVFYRWRMLIFSKKLVPPFKLVHIDAHSDLGLGLPSWEYLHTEFLSLDLQDRPNARRGNSGVNFANYLAFALGCRWISTLDFIFNKNWSDDIPRYLLTNKSYKEVENVEHLGKIPYSHYRFEIELEQINKEDIKEITSDAIFFDKRMSIGEPIIPFNIITIENLSKSYCTQEWDYIFFSHSPGYIPTNADYLLEVCRNFISTY